MPWAASTLYLVDTPDARAVVEADGRLAGHVYALDLATLTHAPQFSGTGRLLVLRSPGRPRDLALLLHGFDWSTLDGALAPRLAAYRPGLTGVSARIAAPDAALRWLEDLAARVNGRVCWYQAEAMGGDPDGELAWVIDGPGPEAGPCLYARRDGTFVRVGAGGVGPADDPLAMGLRHLGIHLDSPWFEPHAPHFDWNSRRLAG